MATSRIDGVYSNNTRTPHCSTKRRPPLLPSTASTRIADPPRQMKTYGFRNSNLNVEDFTGDGLDLDLAGRWSPLACSKCAYTCPTMIYLTCGHTLCEACHLEPYQPYATMTVYVSRHTRAHCPFCREDVAYLPVAVRESFISQLRCLCPDCNTSVSLRNIKKHLARCAATLFVRLSVDKPRYFLCSPQSKEEQEEEEEEEKEKSEEAVAAAAEEGCQQKLHRRQTAKPLEQRQQRQRRQQQLSEVQPRDPSRPKRNTTDLKDEECLDTPPDGKMRRELLELPLMKANGTQNEFHSSLFTYQGVTFRLEVHAKDAASLVVVDVEAGRRGRVQGFLYMDVDKVVDLRSLPDDPKRALCARVALKPLVDFTKLSHVPIVIVGRQS